MQNLKQHSVKHDGRARFSMPGRGTLAMLGLALLVLSLGAHAADGTQIPDDVDLSTWNKLRVEHFGERPIADAAGVVSLDAPYRAENPAVVPITIRDELAGNPDRRIKKIWLIIDNNPEPMSAEFVFGPAARSATVATRVRVNAFTVMRVIADTNDHELYMTERYVKAAGGCSAPVGTDPKKALKNMGEMRLRRLADSGSANAPDPQVQLMIRHPNITGLQMDQLTRLVWPAHFVDAITIHKGDKLVLDSHMTFSLNENPSLRFDPSDAVAGSLSARVHDNKDNVFTHHWAPKPQTTKARAAAGEEAPS